MGITGTLAMLAVVRSLRSLLFAHCVRCCSFALLACCTLTAFAVVRSLRSLMLLEVNTLQQRPKGANNRPKAEQHRSVQKTKKRRSGWNKRCAVRSVCDNQFVGRSDRYGHAPSTRTHAG